MNVNIRPGTQKSLLSTRVSLFPEGSSGDGVIGKLPDVICKLWVSTINLTLLTTQRS